ncbi:bile acid:sodium symporter family protein [uncultured Aquabacterium sp.]|jgi:sodium/bile acid cotransporter 7|uniref:bile acid:sodium symporter family protein n=1 Tax=uncultured Aquabacterium sp. TaxID=158753 RepID=UPI0026235A75|nr:bile acid:sodium symporter family protein [uncultured Aquabacterium sp.]
MFLPTSRPPRAVRARQSGVIDWFLVAMMVAVAVASFAPQWGRSEGPLRLGQVTDIGVFLLFFLHGMGLSTDSLKAGATRWKLHLLVQGCTYVLFPLWWAVLALLVGRWVPHDLLMGFFYLAVLPSTVSSSVALTAVARGHVAAAVLNATLSTLLGVFLTPLLVSLVIGQSATGAGLEVGPTMLKVAQMLLLPFVAGHLLRPVLGAFFARIKRYTTVFDRGVIVLLVWSAFSDSVADGLWSRHGVGLLLQAAVGVVLFLMPMLWVTRWLARRQGLPVEDEIVAVFCGSKKTLASGMPMAKLLFGGSAAMGVLVLPIMLYHQLQLFVCAVMARRYAARSTQRVV